MLSSGPHPLSRGGRRRAARLLILSASLAALATAVAAAASTQPSGKREAGELDASLTRIVELTRREVKPAARRLGTELPAGAQRLNGLREAARATQDQAEIALDELRQMSLPATLDPHYAPALVAAGRAFVAASGQDPLTRTTIDPGYTGLESELEASEARLTAEGAAATKLSTRIGHLDRALARARGRAARLARLLRRDSAPRGR